MDQILKYATKRQTGVSLRQMVQFGLSPSPRVLFNASMFLAEELPIRLAHRIKELESLPMGLNKMASIQKVSGWYQQSFKELQALPVLDYDQPKKYFTPSDEPANLEMQDFNKQFLDTLTKIKKRHDPTVITVAQGVNEWKESRNIQVIDDSVQTFLDRFYMSRIGIRMLIGQQIALLKNGENNVSDPDYVGIICTNTNISDICQVAIENARFITQQHFGIMEAPQVELHCDPGIEFMYVPGHLIHMMMETLKNSLRATVERAVELQQTDVHDAVFPPVKVIVSEGVEDITVKISDEGGGIARSNVPLVYTYLYTTMAEQPSLDTEHEFSENSAPLAGFGYGLALSRLYARYFGGDLRLISMEGYGTDVYLHLNRLSSSSEPLA